MICCPLQAELLRNYRREVLLARRLAARGIAVQRFHYRGSGHSDGDTSATTLESMIDDALAASTELVERAGVSNVAYLGTRWGALVAGAAASLRRGPLALWEPVLEPERYFEEILRFRLMFEMKADPQTPISHEVLLDELRRAGSVDVLGHTLERALYQSAAGRSLAALVGERPPPAALLVQVGVKRTISPGYAALAAVWRGRGSEVEAHVVRDREAWWLSGDLWPVHETHAPTSALLETTTRWTVGRLTREAAT